MDNTRKCGKEKSMSGKDTLASSVEEILPACCQSAEQVFKTMVFMPLTTGDPVTPDKNSLSGEISANIGLTGDNLRAGLSLVFSTELAGKIFASMMMQEYDSNTNVDELKDTVGELANMVAGGAKTRLQDNGVDFSLSLPTVVVGKDHTLGFPADAATRIVPMAIDSGSFLLGLSVS